MNLRYWFQVLSIIFYFHLNLEALMLILLLLKGFANYMPIQITKHVTFESEL